MNQEEVKTATNTLLYTSGGAIVGAGIGSVVPVVGTLFGALVGGTIGIVRSSIHHIRAHKENLKRKNEQLKQYERIFNLDDIDHYDINDLNEIYLRLKVNYHPDRYHNFPSLKESQKKKLFKIVHAYEQIKMIKGWNNENSPQQE